MNKVHTNNLNTKMDTPSPSTSNVSADDIISFEKGIQPNTTHDQSSTNSKSNNAQTNLTPNESLNKVAQKTADNVFTKTESQTHLVSTTDKGQTESKGMSQNKAHGDTDNTEQKYDKNSRADAILNNITGHGTIEGTSINSSSINATSNANLDPEIINKLVDNILVATNDNKQEVLIKISNTVLADTQIMLKMEDGKLSVQLQTHDTDSAYILHQHVNALRESLTNNCKATDVDVEIIETNNQNQNNNNDGQNDAQSRGHFLWNNEG